MNENKRDISIDILRGIAIFIMLGANIVGYVTPCEFHPLWFDIYSSFAAPLFVLLSGYMVAVNCMKKHTNLFYYLKRGGMLILTAALIDAFLWQILPFAIFDVLNVIGIGLLVVFLLEKTPLWVKTSFIAIVLIITAILQNRWSYIEIPMEIEFLSAEADYSGFSFLVALKAMIYDGWFPIFPWIAFPVLGSIFAHYRKKWNNSFANMRTLAIGLIFTISGFVWLYFRYTNPGAEQPFDELVKRVPYGEIFYPATIAFMIAAFGVCLLIFSFVDKTRNSLVWKPLTVFGQTSMFNYIFHTAIVAYITLPLYEDNPQKLYIGWIVYALLVIVSYALSFLVVIMKRKIKTKNFLFNFYFGG
ncbi:MAG: DUF1624 domain-containing protein [Bacteroidales bacterium]|jgi:uncharacterized membrane protein|nr:DUF1624 domain-containing protein [Bacteroidales bacterium]